MQDWSVNTTADFEKLQITNNSGQGNRSTLPPELSSWNWGAFFLSWIWGIGNNTWIAFLTFIPLVNLVMIFILGAKGTEWAWQNKTWENYDHFKRVQKLWATWGLILFIIFVLLLFFITIAALSAADVYDY